MEELQIADGDILALHIRDMVGEAATPAQPRGQPAPPQPAPDTETLRLRLIGDPSTRAELQRTRPELASALDDPVRFREVYMRLADVEVMERERRRQQIAELNNDPFDVEAQARIEEMIRQERVQENLQNAIEYNPEGLISHFRTKYSN